MALFSVYLIKTVCFNLYIAINIACTIIKNINLRICFSLIYYPQEVSIAAQHDKVYRLPYYQNVDKVVLVSYFEYDKSYLASRQLSPLDPLVEHQNIHPRKGNQLISECPLVLLLSMDIN